jgi:hypothetical protein
MSVNGSQAKLADFLPLYEAGAYTSSEFFWFALPLFDGTSGDKELWEALPRDVKDCFLAQMEKDVATSDAAGVAIAERLSAVRRVAMR